MNTYNELFDFCHNTGLAPAQLVRWQTARIPPKIAAYFETRGLTPDMVQEAKLQPLTPQATPQEQLWHKQYLHSPRCNTKGDPAPCVWGIGIPYPIDEEKYGKFGRERGLEWTPEFCEFYTSQNKDVPRYLSPSKKKVDETSHLYILPPDQEKLKKSSTIACIIEGEIGKTLGLSYDLRAIETDVNRYAAVGISGVDQLLSAPETHEIVWKNRIVYIFFDADSLRKPEVAHAEMKIAAFFMSRGARSVKSCVWKEERGKGYDDYQVYSVKHGFPRDFTLSNLLKRAVPTFRKYAPIDDFEGFPLPTYCSALARVPNLQNYAVKPIMEDIASIFKRQGFKVQDVKECLEQETLKWEREKAKQQLEKSQQELQERYGISYVPELPKEFRPLNGFLSWNDMPMCSMFIIKKYISTQESDKQDYYLLGFKNKELEIPSNKFSKYRDIAEIFGRNQEILHDSAARAVQKYVSQYWLLNKTAIPVVSRHTNTGWDKDGVFRLPTVDEQAEYDQGIKRAFSLAGKEEFEFEMLGEIYRKHNAALDHLLVLCAPLASKMNMPNYTVVKSGTGGRGKTAGVLSALAQYGDCMEQKHTMDATNVGQELVCSLYKDMPTLMDEANTGSSGDGIKMMQTFINTIYGFDAGKGRSRGDMSSGELTLKNVNEYRGLLFLTSERSLSTIMSVSRNMTVGGIFRRVLEIPCDNPDFPLWNYGEKDKEKPFFDNLFTGIQTNFGHFGARWIKHISDPAVLERITKKYKYVLEQFSKVYSLKGTENLWCLVEAITPEVETLLGLEPLTISKNLKEFISHILDHNQQQIDDQIHNTVENFMECLDHFMNENLTAFIGLSGERDDPTDAPDRKVLPTRILGKYEQSDSNGTEVWLTIPAMEELCNKFGLNKNGVLEQLKAQGRIEWKDETDKRDPKKVKVRPVYYFDKWIYSKNCKTYHIYLVPPEVTPQNPVQEKMDLHRRGDTQENRSAHTEEQNSEKVF